MYLIDSNIFIRFLKGDEKLINYLNDLVQESFAISMVSRFEILIGAGKDSQDIEEIESYLDDCEHINISKELIKTALKINQTSKKRLKFKDLIIAATAINKNKILISSDKDFKNIPNLKVKLYLLA